MMNTIRALINSKLFKDSFLFSFFSFLNSGLNFILLLVLAHFLSVADYGNLNLYSIFVTLVSFVISLNTNGYLSVVFFNRDHTYINQVINVVITISFGVLIFLFLFFSFSPFVINCIGLQLPFIYISLFVCFFQSVTSLFLDLLRLEEKVNLYGSVSVLQVFSNVVITIFLITIFKLGWESRAFAQITVSLFFFIVSLILFSKKKYLGLCRIRKDIFVDSLKFGLPLIPHAISSWIRQGFDRYVINSIYDVTVVGVYSLSFNIANIIHLVGYAFNSANSVYIYKLLSKNDDCVTQKLSRLTIFMIVFFLVLTIFISMASYNLIPIFFPKYVVSLSNLLPLCFAAMFQCIYYLYVNYLFYYQKTKILMIITFTVSLFHLVLTLLLTKYSVAFVAYINMFSNAIITLLVYLYSQRLYKLKIIWKK